MRRLYTIALVPLVMLGCRTKPDFEAWVAAGDSAKIAAIARRKQHPDRLQAIHCLGSVPDVAVLRLLLELLHDADVAARYWAARGIGETGRMFELPKETVTALLDLLERPDYEPREAIAVALGQLGSARAVLGLADQLVAESDPKVQEAIMVGLREAFYMPPVGGEMATDAGEHVVHSLLAYSRRGATPRLQQEAEACANGIHRRKGKTWGEIDSASVRLRPNVPNKAHPGGLAVP